MSSFVLKILLYIIDMVIPSESWFFNCPFTSVGSETCSYCEHLELPLSDDYSVDFNMRFFLRFSLHSKLSSVHVSNSDFVVHLCSFLIIWTFYRNKIILLIKSNIISLISGFTALETEKDSKIWGEMVFFTPSPFLQLPWRSNLVGLLKFEP